MTAADQHEDPETSAAAVFDVDAVFDVARPRLIGRAYRLLGTFVDADDVVQEAWLRWSRADHDDIENPDAWLNTVVTRLAIDHLRRRKREEEIYVGPWLPAPSVAPMGDPSDAAVVSDSLTTAFLVMLERLTPDERVAFLMADVFGETYATIAASTGRTPESCRQLASRARRKIAVADVQRRDDVGRAMATANRFLEAIVRGDEEAALACLAPDVQYIGDGGASRKAARRPVLGPERVVRLFMNLAGRFEAEWMVEAAMVGGFPGFTISTGTTLSSATSAEVVDGKIVRIMTVMNPDKLTGIRRPGELGLG